MLVGCRKVVENQLADLKSTVAFIISAGFTFDTNNLTIPNIFS